MVPVVLGAGAMLLDAFGVSLPVDVDFEESVSVSGAGFVGESVTASFSDPSVGAGAFVSGAVVSGAVGELSSGLVEPSGLCDSLGLVDSSGLLELSGLFEPSGLCEPSGDWEPLGDSLSLGDGRFVSDGVGFGRGMTGVSSSGTITSGSGPLGARSGVWEPLPFGAVPALTVRRCELIIA